MACTGSSLNIVFFPYNFVIFLNSASFAAALVFYLSGMYPQTDTEGKQRIARVQNIVKSSEKTPCISKSRIFIFQIEDFYIVILR